MRKHTSLVLAMLLFITVALVGCASVQQADDADQATQTSASAMSAETSEELKEELGAFDIAAEERELAKTNEAGYEPLDAGRGNPNWINTKARLAFTRLMDFAVDECQRDMSEGDMAGHGVAEGVIERFDAAMDPADETDKFLIDAIDYCVKDLGMNKDELLMELVNGIIGDYYPSPSRCLELTEVILNEYLQSTLYNGVNLKGETQVFPTEGGSAAMCYVFHSLEHSYVLKPGDKIALATPIFTPYLQIPHVNNYCLVSINIPSTAENNWDIPEEELAQLENPEIKALFLVNPSNPGSHALSSKTLERLAKVVEKNPNLIILTDDVYGTFVEDFQSVYSVLSHNTILVYSYSKLYGATGWRIGMIAMNKTNVVDRLISELPAKEREELADEYAIVTSESSQLPFIERLCAESRSIGLYHTSGLSTPSQVFMDPLSLIHLINLDNDPYIEQSNKIVNERYLALMDALGLKADVSRENAQYYTIVDINDLIEKRYDKDFAAWKKENVDDVEFLDDLARREGVVLMYGSGFEAPEGCVRISLANLKKDDYVEIARRLGELLDEYHAQYKEDTQLANAA